MKRYALIFGMLAAVAVSDGLAAQTTRDDINTFTKPIVSDTAQKGTCGTGVTCTHYGDGYSFTTKMVLLDVPYTIGDNAKLAAGSLIFTYPDGEILIEGCSMQVGLKLTTGTPTTDQFEICLGTVIGSTDDATCGEDTATFEDIAGPDVAADTNGTINTLTDIGPTADTAGFVIADGSVHTMHLNIADTWANVSNTAALMNGVVYCKWTWFGNPA